MSTQYALHYSHNTFYYGAESEEMQQVFQSANLHLLDVVLLTLQCLAANKPRSVVFLDEFAKICFTNEPVCVPSSEHYRAASSVYFSVRKHLRDTYEALLHKPQIPEFNLIRYAFGTNKQSLAVVIQPL